jgi:hypothetical protein
MRARRILTIAALGLLMSEHAAAALTTAPPPRPAAPKSRAYGWSVRSTAIAVTVDFHGNRAADCAEHGLCDTSGSFALTVPAARGLMVGVTSGGRGFFAGSSYEPARLVAHVVTTGASSPCSDATAGLTATFGVRYGSVPTLVFGELPANTTGLIDPGSAFANRCGGPSVQDLAFGLPRAPIPGFLRMRTFKVVLDQTQDFAGDVFSGTVTATGTLRFRRVQAHGITSGW